MHKAVLPMLSLQKKTGKPKALSVGRYSLKDTRKAQCHVELVLLQVLDLGLEKEPWGLCPKHRSLALLEFGPGVQADTQNKQQKPTKRRS